MADSGKIKILYMEDDPDVARLVRTKLENAGFHITPAQNGRLGLEILRSGEKFDLVAVDHAMPEMTGLEVIRTLAEANELPPTIMITGTGNERLAVEALKMGAMDYLVKDINGAFLQLLPSVIHRVLGQTQAEKDKDNAQKALEQSETRHRSIVECLGRAGTGLVMVGKDKKILYMNSVMKDWFGDQIGATCSEGLFGNTEECSACRMDEVSEKRKTVHCLINAPDGRVFDVIATPYLADDGSFAQLSMLRDVTEEKRIEQQRRKLQEKLSRSQKMEALGLMAGGLAHDLNNILGGIVGYPDILLMKIPGNSPLRKPLENIKKSGAEAVGVVADLLTVARGLTSGREVLSLNRIVESYLGSDGFRELITENEDVDLDSLLDPDLLNTVGSPVHLQKSVANLVKNAREAIDEKGRITIATKNVYLDQAKLGHEEIPVGEYVVLSVADTSMNISPNDLRRIFEPFYTNKVLGRRGAGLGLAIVWNTVHDHDGYIDMETSEEGTTISLYFPATREPIKGQKKTAPEFELLGKGENILLVDDDPVQRETIRTMLEELNYHVEAASDATGAIRILEGSNMDLFILDLALAPGTDTLELAGSMLKIRPGMKPLWITGDSKNELIAQAKKWAGGIHLQKPFTIQALAESLKWIFTQTEPGH